MRRQEKFIEKYLDRGDTFIPDDGCSGPEVEKLSDHEHSMQYFEEEGQFFIVSGAGSRRTPVGLGDGYGGSFWLSPLDYIALSAGMFFSEDDTRFTIKAGFQF